MAGFSFAVPLVEVALIFGSAITPAGHALPLVAAIQLCRFGWGISLAACVHSMPLLPHRPWALFLAMTCGVAAVLTQVGAGVAGTYAIMTPDASLAPQIGWLALASLALTSLWVAAILSGGVVCLGRGAQISGLLFSASALVSLVAPPVALLAGLCGLVWWIALGSAVRKTL